MLIMKSLKILLVAVLAAGLSLTGQAAGASPNLVFKFRNDGEQVYDGESQDHSTVVGRANSTDFFTTDITNGSSGGLLWAHGRVNITGPVGWVVQSHLQPYG